MGIEERFARGGQAVGNKHVEGHTGDGSLDNDFERLEPVLEFATVEHELEAAHREPQQSEAEPIEAPLTVARRLADEKQDARQRQQTEGQIDEENPAPRIILGEVAAQRWPEDRPDHRADAPDSHGLAVLGAGIVVEHQRLRQGHQEGAEGTLQNAVDNNLLQRIGNAAKHGRDREAGHRHHQQTLASKAPG